MGMSRDEIFDLASRYTTPDETTDFPMDGDVFCLLMRATPDQPNTPDEQGWGFSGYGICIGYTADEESKPRGKWLWMHFASLSAFPPTAQVLKLQPPHVVKGRFSDADRTHEIRIIKVNTKNVLQFLNKPEETAPADEPPVIDDQKIVQFRKKNSKK